MSNKILNVSVSVSRDNRAYKIITCVFVNDARMEYKGTIYKYQSIDIISSKHDRNNK